MTDVESITSESGELQKRLSDLCAFMDSDEFLSLSPANRLLLGSQKEVMKAYRDILDIRMELNSKAQA